MSRGCTEKVSVGIDFLIAISYTYGSQQILARGENTLKIKEEVIYEICNFRRHHAGGGGSV